MARSVKFGWTNTTFFSIPKLLHAGLLWVVWITVLAKAHLGKSSSEYVINLKRLFKKNDELLLHKIHCRKNMGQVEV